MLAGLRGKLGGDGAGSVDVVATGDAEVGVWTGGFGSHAAMGNARSTPRKVPQVFLTPRWVQYLATRNIENPLINLSA